MAVDAAGRACRHNPWKFEDMRHRGLWRSKLGGESVRSQSHSLAEAFPSLGNARNRRERAHFIHAHIVPPRGFSLLHSTLRTERMADGPDAMRALLDPAVNGTDSRALRVGGTPSGGRHCRTRADAAPRRIASISKPHRCPSEGNGQWRVAEREAGAKRFQSTSMSRQSSCRRRSRGKSESGDRSRWRCRRKGVSLCRQGKERGSLGSLVVRVVVPDAALDARGRAHGDGELGDVLELESQHGGHLWCREIPPLLCRPFEPPSPRVNRE